MTAIRKTNTARHRCQQGKQQLVSLYTDHAGTLKVMCDNNTGPLQCCSLNVFMFAFQSSLTTQIKYNIGL